MCDIRLTAVVTRNSTVAMEHFLDKAQTDFDIALSREFKGMCEEENASLAQADVHAA